MRDSRFTRVSRVSSRADPRSGVEAAVARFCAAHAFAVEDCGSVRRGFECLLDPASPACHEAERDDRAQAQKTAWLCAKAKSALTLLVAFAIVWFQLNHQVPPPPDQAAPPRG